MATSTNQTYSLGQLLEERMEKNIRLFPILHKQFPHIQHAFFDTRILNGSGDMTVKPKELGSIEKSLTVDGYAIKWYDYSMFDFNTKIKTTAASLAVAGGEATISVENNAGFATNDTIILVKSATGNSDQVQAIVKEKQGTDRIVIKIVKVNGVETVPGTIAVLKGQSVERGYFRRNDNEDVARPTSSYDYIEYKSYIQHFSRQIEFTKEQMNKLYRIEGEPKALADKEFAFAISVMFQEVNKALYLGANK